MKRTLIFIFFILTLLVSSQAQKQYKFGVCMSGGAALGFAHIGALQALEENGIYPEIIAGTSMGAIIGSLYAQGIKPDEILKIIKEHKLYKTSKVMRFMSGKKGISSHKTLRKILTQYLPSNNFDSLKLPLAVCVSNITNAKWKIVNHGNLLHNYIVASASIPGIFEPVQIGDSIYVDGGLYNNLPAQALRDQCEYVIGVDVLPYIEAKTVKSGLEVIGLSIRGLEHVNSLPGRKICDFLIEPNAVKTYDELSFENYMEICKIGYDATIDFIQKHPEIKSINANSSLKN